MFRGSIPALITPFKENGEIDFTSFRNLLHLHLRESSDALLISGSTGEASTLTTEEFSSLLSFAVQEIKGNIPVIAGTGSNSTKKAIEKTLLAKNLGANAALILIPGENLPQEEGIFLHFQKINEINFPYIVYYNPSRGSSYISQQGLFKISHLKNCIGFKLSVNKMGSFREFLDLVCHHSNVWHGNDDKFLQENFLGNFSGSFSIVANQFPKFWKKIVDFSLNNQKEQALALYKKIQPFLRAILLEVNPQGIKHSLAHQGLCKDILRAPLMPVKKETQEEIHAELKNFLQQIYIDALN